MVEIRPSDHGDRQKRQHEEKPALGGTEGQQVRNATGGQLEAIRATNQDKSDGSASPRSKAELYANALKMGQDRSIEITEQGESGAERVIAARGMKSNTAPEVPKIAYDLKDLSREWNKGAQKVGVFVDRTKDQVDKPELRHVEAPGSLDLLHPHQGKEDDYVSYGSCRAANMRFEELNKRIGAGSGHVDPNLIAAVIRHEQESYKQLYDSGQDLYIKEHGTVDGISDTVSIGPAQIQIRHISRLVAEFPEQLGHYSKDPLRAALNPGDAPYFVAGYFADVIQHLNKGTRPEFIGGLDWGNVRQLWFEGNLNGALIKSYNPHPKQIEFVMKNLKLIHEKGLK